MIDQYHRAGATPLHACAEGNAPPNQRARERYLLTRLHTCTAPIKGAYWFIYRVERRARDANIQGVPR
ncbi:MAG: hypothetical protein O3C28_08075 [Proteobacteria bacterium]|nr:hypothetical protein [Pseudomonadota bacterium]